MDRLARNAMLARQAGMSYGKWKAMQPVVNVKEMKELPEGWIKCECCEKPFKPFSGNQRYCEYMCRERGYAEKMRQQQYEYRQRKKAEREGRSNDE